MGSWGLFNVPRAGDIPPFVPGLGIVARSPSCGCTAPGFLLGLCSAGLKLVWCSQGFSVGFRDMHVARVCSWGFYREGGEDAMLCGGSGEHHPKGRMEQDLLHVS